MIKIAKAFTDELTEIISSFCVELSGKVLLWDSTPLLQHLLSQ